MEWAEGRERKPYRDSVGKLTIGVGRNLDDRGLRQSEIDLLLTNDIEEVVTACAALPYWNLLDPVRQLVVADLVFNLGLSKWLQFVRANEALERKEWGRAAIELEHSRWFNQTGRRARKLVKAMQTGEWTREK